MDYKVNFEWPRELIAKPWSLLDPVALNKSNLSASQVTQKQSIVPGNSTGSFVSGVCNQYAWLHCMLHTQSTCRRI